MTIALAGHADRNSSDCCTLAGTCVLSIGANANFGKNPCAVVVSRYTSGTPFVSLGAEAEIAHRAVGPHADRDG